MANANTPSAHLSASERETIAHAKGYTLRLQKEGVRALRFEIVSCDPKTLKCKVRGTDGSVREDIHLSRLVHDPVSAATLRQLNRATEGAASANTGEFNAILQSLGMVPTK